MLIIVILVFLSVMQHDFIMALQACRGPAMDHSYYIDKSLPQDKDHSYSVAQKKPPGIKSNERTSKSAFHAMPAALKKDHSYVRSEEPRPKNRPEEQKDNSCSRTVSRAMHQNLSKK